MAGGADQGAGGVAPNEGAAGRFAAGFARWWASPNADTVGALLTEDVRLVQPLSPTTVGLPAAIASFRRLFAEIPDLHAVVDRWRGDDEVVFIEFRLRGTIGGRFVEWPVVDRFMLRGDKAYERVSHFDVVPLARHLVRSPLTALRLLRR